MKRYSIMVQEYGSDHEIELCQMDSDPADVIAGLKTKTLMVHSKFGSRRKSKVQKYPYIRAIDHAETRT